MNTLNGKYKEGHVQKLKPIFKSLKRREIGSAVWRAGITFSLFGLKKNLLYDQIIPHNGNITFSIFK